MSKLSKSASRSLLVTVYYCVMRGTSYGESSELSLLDKLGQFFNQRRLKKSLNLVQKKVKLADIGCGFDSTLSRPIWNNFREVHLFDLSINSLIASYSGSKVELYIGDIMETTMMANSNYDFVICNNVLEHLDFPVNLLSQIYNNMHEGSILFITVPSWRGKFFLEMAAFKFSAAPKFEMEDHRRYYDKWDLWREIRAAGFMPSKIKISSVKFGLSTSAVIRK
jgi:2-polyprenyl-3-methyl-5-hydroxy-6-metoxy-1,4-benzoquinol methylase